MLDRSDACWGTACASRTSRALALCTSAFDTFRKCLDVDLSEISLKNSEIEGRGKSRIHAHSVVYASRCHSKAYERVARSKAGRSAEPLRKFPLRLPAVL